MRRLNGPRLLLLFVVTALALRLYDFVNNQSEYLPWMPLSLSDPIGRFTVRKLGELRDHPRKCYALLHKADIHYSPLPPVHGPGTCGYSDGIRLANGTGLDYGPPFAAACSLAASLHIWSHQVLEPAAYRHFRKPVVQIQTFGTYACRTIGNAEGGAMSQHATANAIDVIVFRLQDGRRVTLSASWDDQGPAGAFLRDVRNGACTVFATTLSPDYNPAHHDHLHFDLARRGGWSFCR